MSANKVMRYARVYLNSDGSIKGVMESGAPFISCRIVGADEKENPFYDLGLVDATEWVGLDGKPCSPSNALFQRLEKHPLADLHDDAPKARVKPDMCEGFDIHFCPASLAGIAAHLVERGLNGLPEPVCAEVKKHFTHSEDYCTPKVLRALGCTFDEIKALPKFATARAAVQGRRLASAMQAAQDDALITAQAITQNRIDRKLIRSKK